MGLEGSRLGEQQTQMPSESMASHGEGVANGALDILCGFSCLSLFLWLEGLLCGLFPLSPPSLFWKPPTFPSSVLTLEASL